MDRSLILSGKVCPYCFSETRFTSSLEVYPYDYGMIYLCKPCDAYVGVHKGTDVALGSLANKALRRERNMAHNYFDQLWHKKMQKHGLAKAKARTLAYEWLSSEMGIDKEITHIAMFDIAQCRRVIELCKPYAISVQ